ncbi:MAG: hypothetical protein KJ971_06870 [Firmicutes bacterium]|nr:hypothetical protein [Bacillota bacterium]
MRFKKGLLFLVAFGFAFALLACNEVTTTTTTAGTTTTTTTTETTTTTTTTVPTTLKLSILDGWVDGADGVNTITQSATQLAVTYDKAGFSWASMTNSMAEEDLSAYNKLVFTVSGQGTLMVKIEGATSNFEVSIQLTAGEVTYQLDLRDYDVFLGGVTQVVLFGAPGKAVGTGNFTMTKFEFDEGTAFGIVLDNGDSNIPENEQVYDGTGETFDFSLGFVDNGDGVYEIDNSGDNPVVTYTKGGFDWPYMLSTVSGDFSDFDYVVLTVKGITAGSVMLKAELSTTVKEEISGSFAIDEEITLCLDLSLWTNEQLDALTKILIFAEGGSTTATGEFEILGAYFSKVYVGEIVEEGVYNFIDGWEELDLGSYTFSTTVDDTTLVTYTKGVGQTYIFMRNDFAAEDVLGLNTMTLVVKGTVDKTILLKPNNNGALEQTVVFTGEEQTIVISAESFTTMLICAEPGTESVSGTFEIISAKLTYIEPNYDFTTVWVENDVDTYTFTTTEENTTTVDYVKDAFQAWAFMKSDFVAEDVDGFNTMTLILKGTIGKSVMLKPNNDGGLEQTVTFTGEEQTIVISAYSFTTMVIFAEAGTESVSGSFEIISARLTYVEPDPIDASIVVDVNVNWLDNDGGIYTFTTVDGVVTVDYTRTSEQTWAFIKTVFLDNLSDHDMIEMVVKGTLGDQLIIKPNNNGAYEQTITFTGEQQVVTFTLTDAPTFILILVDPIFGSLTGSFEIISAKVTSSTLGYDFTKTWVENDVDTYDFTILSSGTTQVDYTKGVDQGWTFMKSDFVAEDILGLNTLTIILKGTLGESIMLKPNDDGALEQTVVFTGEEQTIVITAAAFTSMVMFVQPGTAEVSGTFEIISAKLTYIEPCYDFTTGWAENDVNTYNFTTQEDGSVLVNYTKWSDQAWAFMKNDFVSEEAQDFNTMTIILKGPIGKTLLIKPNDNNSLEQNITFTGEEQTIIITSVDEFTKILMFAEPNIGLVKGSFEIISARLTYIQPAPIDPWVDVVLGDNWEDVDGGIYTFTDVEGSILVEYDRTSIQTWASINYVFEDNLSRHDTIVIVVNGTAGAQLVIKPNNNGAYEQTITFTGEDQTFTFTLTDTPINILIFVDPIIGSLTGSFEIVSCTVTSTMDTLNFIDGWAENDVDTYTFTPQLDDSLLVNYTKIAGQEWAFMKYLFDEDLALGMNTMTLVVQGTVDKSILLKPNDNSVNEQTVTFTGAEQTVVISLDSFTSMVMFGEAGITDVTGSFVIISAVLSYTNPE